MNANVQILRIIRGTTVVGPGFRTSIYFAGCRHRCPGCHNLQSWDFNAGKTMGIDEILEVIEEEDYDVTLTGGDPLYNPDFVICLADRIHSLGHNIWLYTGFTWEEILNSHALYDAVSHIDVIVDSPFVLSQRDPDLAFRGSSNQRIIDVAQSIKKGGINLWRRE